MAGRIQLHQKDCLEEIGTALADTGETEVAWHVVWTRSNFEQIVRDALLAKGYEVFLPMIRQWSTRQQRRVSSTTQDTRTPMLKIPMFKSYLFVHNCMDKRAYLDISNTKGVTQILGARWDRTARIPDDEIESIKVMTDSRLPLLPYPYLKAGAKVKIVRGALANAHGVLVESDCSCGLFVVSVSLLQRSIAVSIDCADLVPV